LNSSLYLDPMRSASKTSWASFYVVHRLGCGSWSLVSTSVRETFAGPKVQSPTEKMRFCLCLILTCTFEFNLNSCDWAGFPLLSVGKCLWSPKLELFRPSGHEELVPQLEWVPGSTNGFWSMYLGLEVLLGGWAVVDLISNQVLYWWITTKCVFLLFSTLCLCTPNTVRG
jgi:hypothetical protein